MLKPDALPAGHRVQRAAAEEVVEEHCEPEWRREPLSSLSLVFALHHFKPTPLYFMDEIDAALDFKNVSIVAHYVKEQTKCAPPLRATLLPAACK